jgi:hypothetical protein
LNRPGIGQQYTSGLKVFCVPGHDVNAMASRSSSAQSVACGNDLTGFLRGGCEFSPSVAGFEIDGKDAIRVIAFEGLSHGRVIAGKIQSFEARASSRKKFLEIWAPPGEFFVVTLCYDDDTIIVSPDPLWSFGKSAGNEFTKAVFGICKSPFHWWLLFG